MKWTIVLIVLALIIISSIFYFYFSVWPRKTDLNEYDNPLYLVSDKICNVIPNFKNITLMGVDLCEISGYLRIKRFCGIGITPYERTMIEFLLATGYESNYQKYCKELLNESYSDIVS